MQKKQSFSKPFNLIFTKNYPSLYLGPGIYKKYKDAKNSSPSKWIKSKNLDLIKHKRNKQIFTYKKYNKKDCLKENNFLRKIQLLTQTYRTSELEMDYTKKASVVVDKDSGIKNLGYNLNNIKIVDHLKIPKIIDKTVNDTDLKAENASIKIFNKTKDIYKTQQLFSVGLLGLKKNRVLVPTRWSITASDDIIGKNRIQKIKDYRIISDFEFFKYEKYKNKFYIIFLPEIWGFENIEKQNSFCIDYEEKNPRKTYAKNVTGGYYATRLEVANHLYKRKKQARAIVLRNIHPSYKSQGVWVVREAVKKTLKQKPKRFNTLKEILDKFKKSINKKEVPNIWISKSKLINDYKYQKKIFSYFKKR